MSTPWHFATRESIRISTIAEEEDSGEASGTYSHNLDGEVSHRRFDLTCTQNIAWLEIQQLREIFKFVVAGAILDARRDMQSGKDPLSVFMK